MTTLSPRYKVDKCEASINDNLYTPTEWAIIELLAKRQDDRYLSPAYIAGEVMGDAGMAQCVRWHIKHIRLKADKHIIETRRGYGYRASGDFRRAYQTEAQGEGVVTGAVGLFGRG